MKKKQVSTLMFSVYPGLDSIDAMGQQGALASMVHPDLDFLGITDRWARTGALGGPIGQKIMLMLGVYLGFVLPR